MSDTRPDTLPAFIREWLESNATDEEAEEPELVRAAGPSPTDARCPFCGQRGEVKAPIVRPLSPVIGEDAVAFVAGVFDKLRREELFRDPELTRLSFADVNGDPVWWRSQIVELARERWGDGAVQRAEGVR